jgi:hypothetical protein
LGRSSRKMSMAVRGLENVWRGFVLNWDRLRVLDGGVCVCVCDGGIIISSSSSSSSSKSEFGFWPAAAGNRERGGTTAQQQGPLSGCLLPPFFYVPGLCLAKGKKS